MPVRDKSTSWTVHVPPTLLSGGFSSSPVTPPTVCGEGRVMVLTLDSQPFFSHIHLQIRVPLQTHTQLHIENHVEAQLHLNKQDNIELSGYSSETTGIHTAQINICFSPHACKLCLHYACFLHNT